MLSPYVLLWYTTYKTTVEPRGRGSLEAIKDGRHINCLSLLTWDFGMQGRFDKPTLHYGGDF